MHPTRRKHGAIGDNHAMIVGIAGRLHEPSVDRSEWPATVEREKFRALCAHLGERLGDYGHRILVRSASDGTADRWVVEGYIRASQKGDTSTDPRIFATRGSRGRRHEYEELAEQYPGLFASVPPRTPRARSDHLIACARCHATICLGGAERTEAIGHAVLAARRQLIPVAASGGAAQVLYEFATQTYDAAFLPPQIEKLTLLQELPAPELRTQVDSWLADTASGPTVVIVHGHDPDGLTKLKTILRDRCGLSERNISLMIEHASSAITYPEKWERVARSATAAIVLATPDDEGGLRETRAASGSARARTCGSSSAGCGRSCGSASAYSSSAGSTSAAI